MRLSLGGSETYLHFVRSVGQKLEDFRSLAICISGLAEIKYPGPMAGVEVRN